VNDVNDVCSNDLWWKIYRADPMNMTFIYIFVTKPDSPEKMVVNENVTKIQNFTAQTWTFLKANENSKWLLKYAGGKNKNFDEKLNFSDVSGIYI
jgi:hypothetical protein